RSGPAPPPPTRSGPHRNPPQESPMRTRVLVAIGGLLAASAVTLIPAGAQAATGQITGLGGKCVDVAAANRPNGSAVQLYRCNPTTAQQWNISSDGTIRALGKCLDVTAAATTNGAKVQLYDCNGTGAQQWTVSAAHDIVNTAADK